MGVVVECIVQLKNNVMEIKSYAWITQQTHDSVRKTRKACILVSLTFRCQFSEVKFYKPISEVLKSFDSCDSKTVYTSELPFCWGIEMLNHLRCFTEHLCRILALVLFKSLLIAEYLTMSCEEIEKDEKICSWRSLQSCWKTESTEHMK